MSIRTRGVCFQQPIADLHADLHAPEACFGSAGSCVGLRLRHRHTSGPLWYYMTISYTSRAWCVLVVATRSARGETARRPGWGSLSRPGRPARRTRCGARRRGDARVSRAPKIQHIRRSPFDSQSSLAALECQSHISLSPNATAGASRWHLRRTLVAVGQPELADL